MDIHFNCTQCGKCCRDTKIPLTVAEAMSWLKRGHEVQLLCEASPWPKHVADDDPRATHFKLRSFAVMSGSLPTRVLVMLVGNAVGPCPNLLADLRCGIYEDRPLVCRIYPAEINPLVHLRRENKLCPPEAWASEQPVLERDGAVMDDVIRQDIQSSRNAAALDADIKSRICVALNVTDAALVHEAVLVYSPTVETLLSAMTFAMTDDSRQGSHLPWRFVSDRSETIEGLSQIGGTALHLRHADAGSYQHLGFQREQLFGPYVGRSRSTSAL